MHQDLLLVEVHKAKQEVNVQVLLKQQNVAQVKVALVLLLQKEEQQQVDHVEDKKI